VIIFRDERGTSLLLLIGLLLIGVSTLFTAINATHYFLKKQALLSAIDRTLMIAVNNYDLRDFRESGEFSDITLNSEIIRAEVPAILPIELPKSVVKELLISRDSISLRAGYQWQPPIGFWGLGSIEIIAEAMIRSQLFDAPA